MTINGAIMELVMLRENPDIPYYLKPSLDKVIETISEAELVEPKDIAEQTEPSRDCITCRYNSDEWDSPKCDGCTKANSNYEPSTEGGQQ